MKKGNIVGAKGVAPVVFARYLDIGEQRKLRDVFKHHVSDTADRDRATIQLLIGSGMRIGECLAITVGDALAAIDCGYLFIPAKNRKKEACDLSIFLTRTVRKALQDLLSLRIDAGLDEALITSRKSGAEPMTVRAFEQRVTYWANKAGLRDGVSPHWFRHTHAKNIMAESTSANPLEVVQRRLGHISARNTAIYTQMDREQMEAALSETDSAVNGKKRLRMADLKRGHERRLAA